MSDAIKHECGIAFIRLLKPLEYFQEKYGSWMYGINRMYLMMEKQRNRGQDGAGLVSVKLDTLPGTKYINQVRSNSSNPIVDVFSEVRNPIHDIEASRPELLNDAQWSKHNLAFAGEIYLGHLRYGTFGKNEIENVHPVMRENNWKSKNLVVAGNFNLTNVSELFQTLVDLGQHPKGYSDTITMLEQIGHSLDEENQLLFDKYKKDFSHKEISAKIARELDVQKILHDASKDWDGGYVIGGIIGHGDSFIMRDPNGIRPAYYYADDEIVIAASEKAVIQTVMKLPEEDINPITPGHALIVKHDGTWSESEIKKPGELKSCSFERIYFSRGSDREIYQERKKLGELLIPKIVDSINNELENTVFSFIPNTAETAFYGMIKGVETFMFQDKIKQLKEQGVDIDQKELQRIVNIRPRVEKIAIKDVKLRTFITGDDSRDDLVEHVYDITYGTIVPHVDNMVIIDDSIVRGTTLKRSILRILDRLNPKQIVIASSSPQIRFPDCYGIDMAKLSDFIAFQAAIELLKDNDQYYIINEVYKKSKSQENLPKEQIKNYVKEIYAPFTDEQISTKIGEMLQGGINAKVGVVYQSIDNLHKAIPNDRGDWYFTGDYPTPGGNKVVNKSFINFIEGKDQRAY